MLVALPPNVCVCAQCDEKRYGRKQQYHENITIILFICKEFLFCSFGAGIGIAVVDFLIWPTSRTFEWLKRCACIGLNNAHNLQIYFARAPFQSSNAQPNFTWKCCTQFEQSGWSSHSTDANCAEFLQISTNIPQTNDHSQEIKYTSDNSPFHSYLNEEQQSAK